ncbi:hypothetical protein [Stenotrophomonas sp.]|uniref:hypothetical protein n=1 Tax=Stenotrophomonas sp. TaxID=69392 RepID=UPI0028989C22|nr:hypothetical protein [Stenotrophomonas sp.]
MNRNLNIRLAVAVAALAVFPVLAQPQVAEMRAREVMTSEPFLVDHPDMRYRQLGRQAQLDGRMEQARGYFLIAARYADKLSQAALAEMWWRGEGGPTDRTMAYIWMDLAAERGTPFLLVERERYWADLDPAERARAVSEGAAVYAEYGDPSSKPRMERQLRTALKRMSGSRTGAVPRMEMVVRESRGMRRVGATTFYRAEYWQPTKYWEWRAAELGRSGNGIGTVDVGRATGVPRPAD